MYIDLDALLPQHQYLLLVDPEKLREGPLANTQVWASKTEAARSAKEKVDEAGTMGVAGPN